MSIFENEKSRELVTGAESLSVTAGVVAVVVGGGARVERTGGGLVTVGVVPMA